MYLTVFSSILDGSKKLCKNFAKFLQSFCNVFKNFANYHKPFQPFHTSAPIYTILADFKNWQICQFFSVGMENKTKCVYNTYQCLM